MRLSLCLCSVLFAACGSDAGTFEDASDQELQRTMMAAMSMDTVMVGFLAVGYASAEEGGCPNVHIEGDRRTVTGGCTTEDGEKIEGEMILENVPGLFGGNDPTRPQLVQANSFVVGESLGRIEIDGTITATSTSTEADIRVELLGMTVATSAKFGCVDGLCTYQGASLDIEGIGDATLEGSFSFQDNTISVDLQGRDHLQLRSEGECVAYVAGGRSGAFCNNQN